MENRHDDIFAAGALKASKRLGLKVSEAVRIIGFDNPDTSMVCDPTQTTVKQPQYQLGF